MEVRLYLVTSTRADAPLATMMTPRTGTYEFVNLDPGSYRVEVVLPRGYFATAGGCDDREIDSDIDDGVEQSYNCRCGPAS